MGGRGDEPGEHRLGDPAQRVLAQVGAAELVGADAEPVAALLGQVHDEALVAASTLSRWYVVELRGSPRSRAIADAGSGAAWRASSLSSCSAWAAAGAFSSQIRDSTAERCLRAGAPRWSDARPHVRASRYWSVSEAPSLEDVVAVARDGAPVELSPEALDGDRRSSRASSTRWRPTWCRTTASRPGSARSRRCTSRSRSRIELQRGLIRSHAAGSGDEVEREVVRALMLLRLSTLATGRTGVRPVVADAYAAMLSAGITPVVHEYGSLGCSGDLAPLAHCALALMGEGPVRDAAGALRDAADALREAGIEPVVLREKEGLALINGTDGMLGMLVLAIADLRDAAGDAPTSPPR